MGVLKLWVKVENQYPYNVTINEGFLDLSKGVYVVSVLYRGVDDNEGLFITKVGNQFIISDKISSDVSLSTNIPQWLNRVGVYSLDTTKAPVNSNTMYKSGNNYMSLGGGLFTVFGNKIAPNDTIHGSSRFDRDGNMISFYTTLTRGNEFDSRVENTSWDYNGQTFMKTQDEVDNNIDIRGIALAAALLKDYHYQITSLDNWSGWSSTSLTGLYQSFGDESGTQKIGYFQYRDSSNNAYVLTKDIVEKNGVWSVRSSLDNNIYTTTTEPTDTDTTFNNPDSGSFVLAFESYVALESIIWHVQNGVNIL